MLNCANIFLTDILRYKPIIILEALSLFGTWALLLWGTTVWHMQLMQIIFGISSAAEIAYYSYMYAVVNQKYYKLITSYIRAAALVGKFLAFGLGQFLISFGSVCVVLCIAAILPPIQSKMAANKVVEISGDKPKTSSVSADYEEELKNDQRNFEERTALSTNAPNVDRGTVIYFRAIWYHFKIFKRNKIVLKWSIWWALTSCGIFQIMNYVQTLWATMQTSSDTYNGITECVNTFIGAFISFLVQYMNVNWSKRGEYVLLITSAFISVLLIIMSQAEVVYVNYALYVVVITIYHLLITVASVNIATQLDSASYGLVFGWNTFLALFLQTILTFAVADKHGFSLLIRTQFIVYGCYFAMIAIMFVLILGYKLAKYACRKYSVSRPISVDCITVLSETNDIPAILMLNMHALNLTLNWLCNVENFSNVHRRLLIFAFDRITYKTIRKSWPKIKVIFWPLPEMHLQFKIGDRRYQMLQYFRAKLCSYLASIGRDFWIIQADTYWRKNLFEIINTRQMLGLNGNLLFDQEGDKGLLMKMIAGDNNIMGALCITQYCGNKCVFIPYTLISNWRWYWSNKTYIPALLQFDSGTNSKRKFDNMKKLGAEFVNITQVKMGYQAKCFNRKAATSEDLIPEWLVFLIFQFCLGNKVQSLKKLTY
ncbi:Protein CBR-FOLT-1 [Dirofilaria immitis]|nr:Protein CBR-FOLT-1 [Dirofilaria immitis]